jgi:hypothetical protein
MDNYASWIEGCLDEEESVCDLIKEYYFYADALKALCDRQAVAQLEAERAEDQKAAKTKERDAIAAGDYDYLFTPFFVVFAPARNEELSFSCRQESERFLVQVSVGQRLYGRRERGTSPPA